MNCLAAWMLRLIPRPGNTVTGHKTPGGAAITNTAGDLLKEGDRPPGVDFEFNAESCSNRWYSSMEQLNDLFGSVVSTATINALPSRPHPIPPPYVRNRRTAPATILAVAGKCPTGSPSR